jgi:hypothetical protein
MNDELENTDFTIVLVQTRILNGTLYKVLHGKKSCNVFRNNERALQAF